MKQRIEQLGMLSLVILVLFSTTGVTIYQHICGCQPTMVQVVHHAEEPQSCCQVPELPVEPGAPACCADGDHSSCEAEDSNGCSNELTYLKAPIVTTAPIQEISLSVASFDVPDFLMPDAGILRTDVANKFYSLQQEHPPPARIKLFILLNQLRIPFPEDHC